MRLRDTIFTGGASYLQMASLIVTQLVSIPIALRFLSHDQFGLWSFTSQSLGYLLLVDLGVSSSVGRLMADPLHRGNKAEDWNTWYNLFLVILLIQASLILMLGLFLVEPILHWFKIPPELHDEAKNLWVMMLFVNAFAFPFRLYPGLLNAQNRGYWALLASAVAVWVGLAVFYIFLRLHFHSLAYGYSSMATMLVSSQLTFWAVMRGPHQFNIRFHKLPWRHIREVFGFSSAIFIIGIAVQMAFLSQSLIITKLIGLSAVASFTVCSRVPMLLMQLIWRPFDAFNPRWQIHWCREEQATIQEELRHSVRLTIGLALTTATCCFAANRWFVYLFAHQDLYQGKWFDLFFAIFVIVQVWNHCISFIFVLTKKLKWFAGIVCVDTVLGIIVCILVTRGFGLIGYIAGSALYTCVSLTFWYITLKGPAALGVKLSDLVRGSLKGWAILLGVFIAGAMALIVAYARHSPALFWLELVLFIAAPLTFLWLYRNDLSDYFKAFKNFIKRYLAPESSAQPQG